MYAGKAHDSDRHTAGRDQGKGQVFHTLWQSLLNAVSTAVGYTLALVLFSCIRERLEDSDAPECMKNLPLALITASCMSIAIMGFAGIH